jgi:hypothetical protein
MRPGAPRLRACTARRALTHCARSLGSVCHWLSEQGPIGQILKQPKVIAEGVIEIAPYGTAFDALDRRDRQAQCFLQALALVREIGDAEPDAHGAGARHAGHEINAAKNILATGLAVNACGEAVRPGRAKPDSARPDEAGIPRL